MAGNIFENLARAFSVVRDSPNDVRQMVMLPPDPDVVTDEEEYDENATDLGQTGHVSDVSGFVEVEYDELVDELDEEDEDDNVPLAALVRRKRMNELENETKSKQKRQDWKWVKTEKPTFTWKEFKGVPEERMHNLVQRFDGLKPIEVFDIMWSEVDDLLVQQSLKYAKEVHGDHKFMLCNSDVRRFNGILLLSGYHTLPTIQHYWDAQPDLCVCAVKNAMSRNQFQQIKSYLHMVDNSTFVPGTKDKMWKMKPLYSILNTNFQQFGYFHKRLSVDESMVPYFGKHGLKMFIRNKPIRFGFKNWSLCGDNGYLYKFETYQGAEEKSADPLGTRVVMKAVQNLLPGEGCCQQYNFIK
jgi:hypothetical protein